MNSKNTKLWFVVAAMLFAFIFIFQHYFRPVAVGPAQIFPGLRPQSVTGVEVIPKGAAEIRADRTNNSWMLTNPVSYPAQTAAIETLLAALQKLTPPRQKSAPPNWRKIRIRTRNSVLKIRRRRCSLNPGTNTGS